MGSVLKSWGKDANLGIYNLRNKTGYWANRFLCAFKIMLKIICIGFFGDVGIIIRAYLQN